MAIQVVNLAVPNGDTPRSANTKINENFSNQTHAASRLVGTANGQVPLAEQIPSLFGTAATKNVGTAAGNVMQVGAFGLGVNALQSLIPNGGYRNASGFFSWYEYNSGLPNIGGSAYMHGVESNWSDGQGFQIGRTTGSAINPLKWRSAEGKDWHTFYTSQNTTKDANGFLKGASPVIDLYDNKMGLNNDAEQQGSITFEKLGVGDYLVKGSLGFAQEGWYIETPKDANGNVLVAVVYEQLANNDLSIKTYAKRFDEETGDVVPNLTRPRDIPAGRFISLRLHELPKEPPVMPTEV